MRVARLVPAGCALASRLYNRTALAANAESVRCVLSGSIRARAVTMADPAPFPKRFP